MLGGTIKLMGVSKRLPGNKVAAFVSPTYVRDDDTLASVSGATNAIEVLSDNLVQSTYTGQGAGRFPTANSCINDILKIAKGDTTSLPFNAPTDLTYVEDYLSKFYLRLKVSERTSRNGYIHPTSTAKLTHSTHFAPSSLGAVQGFPGHHQELR